MDTVIHNHTWNPNKDFGICWPVGFLNWDQSRASLFPSLLRQGVVVGNDSSPPTVATSSLLNIVCSTLRALGLRGGSITPMPWDQDIFTQRPSWGEFLKSLWPIIHFKNLLPAPPKKGRASMNLNTTLKKKCLSALIPAYILKIWEKGVGRKRVEAHTHAHEWGEGQGGRGERISKQTPCWAQSPRPWDHDLSQNQESLLNRLSNPGAPNTTSITSKVFHRDPWVAQRFSAWLQPRAWSWGPGVVGSSPTSGSLHGACLSLCACLSVSH